MSKDRIFLALFLCSVSCAGGLWLRSVVAMEIPLQGVAAASADAALRPIPTGRDDVRDFLKLLGYTGDFRLDKAIRDEQLGRRYYQIQVDAADVARLRECVATGWTNGRFNRAVYQNGASGGLPRSRNLPRWWSIKTPPEADQIMLDHGGNPNWYLVIARGGEVCLMWTGR